jgi:thiol-disulfide isomerase/thioredoxin
MYSPIFKKVVTELGIEHEEIMIDDPDNKDIVNKYEVSSVPTTVLINSDGSSIVHSGLMNETQLKMMIEQGN